MDHESRELKDSSNTKDDTQPTTPDSDNELLKLYKELSDHAKIQIDRAWKAYALLAPIIGIIISVGLIILYFMYGNSIKSIEEGIQGRTEIVRIQLDKKLESEFNNDNIQVLIKKAANEAAVKHIDIDNIKSMVNSEVTLIIANELDKLDKRIQLLRDENIEALKDLGVLLELNFALYDASYEIGSLRRVKAISKSNNSNISTIADKCFNRIINEIKIDHSRLESDRWGFKSIDDAYFGLIDTKDWDLSQFIDNYGNIANDQRVVYVYRFLSDNKKDDTSKFKFSHAVLDNESRPDVIYTICSFINAKASINKDYLLETDQYKEWLESRI